MASVMRMRIIKTSMHSETVTDNPVMPMKAGSVADRDCYIICLSKMTQGSTGIDSLRHSMPFAKVEGISTPHTHQRSKL